MLNSQRRYFHKTNKQFNRHYRDRMHDHIDFKHLTNLSDADNTSSRTEQMDTEIHAQLTRRPLTQRTGIRKSVWAFQRHENDHINFTPPPSFRDRKRQKNVKDLIYHFQMNVE